MTDEIDLLGRPPRRRPTELSAGQGAFDRVAFDRAAAPRQGRVLVRVPLNISCSMLGETSQWVTLPAAPWETRA